MLASAKHETITETLLRELQTAKRGLEVKVGALEEYSQALRRFADWILDGRMSGHFEPACNGAEQPPQTLSVDVIQVSGDTTVGDSVDARCGPDRDCSGS